MSSTQNTPPDAYQEILQLQERIAQLEKSEALLKKAETTLKNEAIRRRILVEQSTDGIVVLTTDGKVYEANQKYADMLGYTFEEAQQLSIWDWEKNFSREAVLQMIDSVDETGDHFETRHTRKDGTLCDVEISTNGTLFDGQKLIFCVCRDITERKRNEEQLRESQELLATFIDNFRGIAYQVSLAKLDIFTPELFGGAIDALTGYSNDTFSHTSSWNSLVMPEDLKTLIEIRHRLITTPAFIAEAQYRIVHKDGTLRWVREVAQVVTMGKKQLVHGTIFDITEQKSAQESTLRLEEQIRHSQKIEAIGTLAGGVAHDFNNILGIIMGYTDLALAELSCDSKPYEKCSHIKKACLRAREIIRQLLTFSRKVGPQKQPFNLSTIITETATFLKSTLPSSTHIMVTMPADKLMVLADPTQMHQVILNLCVNASQALPAGEGTISIAIRRTDVPVSCQESAGAASHLIQVQVHDTGCGIPSEVKTRIFEPYFTTKDTGKGSGMGLAVVHGIIENHSGTIEVESTPENGTTFTFTLPEYTRSAGEFSANIETAPVGIESILFIDDEEEIVTIAKLILGGQGFRVSTATNPLLAIDIFKNEPMAYDLIVTDMTMPQLSGEQLYHEVKKIRSDIPVILCTGHSSQINEQRALALGIDAFILKPLGKTDLTEAIRKVLDKKRESVKKPQAAPY